MTKNTITSCWEVIRTNMPSTQDSLLALQNISNHLLYFGINAPNTMPTLHTVKQVPLPDSPSFAAANNEHIIYLRHCVHNKINFTEANQWSEKLLRFCEVRLASLKVRMLEKCGTSHSAKLHALLLCSLFIDHYNETNDLRFLNTALKLADQTWISDNNTLLERLNKKNQAPEIDILEFRILITLEHALEVLIHA